MNTTLVHLMLIEIESTLKQSTNGFCVENFLYLCLLNTFVSFWEIFQPWEIYIKITIIMVCNLYYYTLLNVFINRPFQIPITTLKKISYVVNQDIVSTGVNWKVFWFIHNSKDLSTSCRFKKFKHWFG